LLEHKAVREAPLEALNSNESPRNECTTETQSGLRPGQ
jgi:hypothetical protein